MALSSRGHRLLHRCRELVAGHLREEVHQMRYHGDQYSLRGTGRNVLGISFAMLAVSGMGIVLQ